MRRKETGRENAGRKNAEQRPLQSTVDVAAWRLVQRREPRVARRIERLLGAGADPERVVAAVSGSCPELALMVPCAVHGCLLSSREERGAPSPGRSTLLSAFRALIH